MTTTQVPSPDTPGVAMYPHELRRGDFVFAGGCYRAFRFSFGSRIFLDGYVIGRRSPDHMVEVVR